MGRGRSDVDGFPFGRSATSVFPSRCLPCLAAVALGSKSCVVRNRAASQGGPFLHRALARRDYRAEKSCTQRSGRRRSRPSPRCSCRAGPGCELRSLSASADPHAKLICCSQRAVPSSSNMLQFEVEHVAADHFKLETGEQVACDSGRVEIQTKPTPI